MFGHVWVQARPWQPETTFGQVVCALEKLSQHSFSGDRTKETTTATGTIPVTTTTLVRLADPQPFGTFLLVDTEGGIGHSHGRSRALHDRHLVGQTRAYHTRDSCVAKRCTVRVTGIHSQRDGFGRDGTNVFARQQDIGSPKSSE